MTPDAVTPDIDPATGGAGARVLIVEDDHDMRMALREVFQIWGMRVDTVCDGVEAASRAFRHAYDVVVSDIRVPGMTGIALTRTLQQHPHPPRVILITAFPEWQIVQGAYEAGASAVVRKPFDLGALAKQVARAALERAKG